jgi:hypothetical protein
LAIETAGTRFLMSEFSPLSGYCLAPTKPTRGSTEATSHSDMAGTSLELRLRADGNWLHDAHEDDALTTSRQGLKYDKRNCKGIS